MAPSSHYVGVARTQAATAMASGGHINHLPSCQSTNSSVAGTTKTRRRTTRTIRTQIAITQKTSKKIKIAQAVADIDDG